MTLDWWTRAASSALGLFAPSYARRWIAARNVLRKYQGASTAGHNSKWRPSKKSADAILATDSNIIRDRARDLVRNNSHVCGAIRKIVSNVVHKGIKPQFRRTKRGKTPDDAWNDRVEAAWAEWSQAECFWQVQQLVLSHWWVDGEVLVHFWEDQRRAEDGINPLRLRVLESDFLDDSVDGDIGNGRFARRGVEIDSHGDPVAYHILDNHPGDSHFSATSRRISAENIVHIFLPERASQTRGISRMASIIEEMRDFGEYQANERIAARLAASFGIFVKQPLDMNPLVDGYDPLDTEKELTLDEEMHGGRIQLLPHGADISVANSSRPGQTYEPYTKTSLKGASVGFGLRYGNFSHDYTDSSYSSERSAALDERRSWQCQQQFLIDSLCRPVMRRWAELSGFIGLNAKQILAAPVDWQCPGWPWVDPMKDAKAAEIELAMGTTTLAKICAAKGDDWHEIHDQRAEEVKRRKADGLQEMTQIGDLFYEQETDD